MDDLDRLVSFTLAEAREAENLEKDPQIVAQAIQAGMLDPEIARYWVLECLEPEHQELEHQAKRVIGSVSVVKEWSDWHAGYYWWVQSMFVDPGYRGRQLAALLLDEVRHIARSENALDLRLYVHKDNIRAIKAYRRAGFAEAPYAIMRMAV